MLLYPHCQEDMKEYQLLHSLSLKMPFPLYCTTVDFPQISSTVVMKACVLPGLK